MKISLTGTSGFIGKKIADLCISKGYLISCLSRKKRNSTSCINYYQGDLAINSDSLHAFLNEADLLIHCAGELNDESVMYTTHVDGTRLILNSLNKLCKKNKIFHWIQLSSCGAYGVESYKSSEVEITESTPTSPKSTYEITKTLADELIIEFAKNHDWFKYTILRPTIVFGDDGMRSNAIQRLVKLIKLRLFFYVEDKQSVANYVHVDDVVNAINLCVMNEKAFNQVFIVSNDCEFKDFINAIAKSIHVGNPLLVLKKKTAIGLVKLINFFGFKSIKKEQLNVLSRKVHFSSAKIQQAIGWEPKANVPEQLEKMISKKA